MDAEQESRAMFAFLALACIMLVALILELIWGAQWRWLATTALVGVVLSVIVPFVMVRARPALTLAIAPDLADPHPSSPSPTPPVAGPPDGQGVHPATWSVGQLAPPSEYFRSWQPTPLPTGAKTEAEPVVVPEPPEQPEPPKSFSPVAPPPPDTLRWPRSGQSS